METLPQEMVQMITQYMTPQDLARCCYVCRDWYNIFNEDCHWKPHVDPVLEEHLHTTPSVVEPVFVSVEADNSILNPISRGRLVFLKEKQLWNNWKKGNYKREIISLVDGEVKREFLTNTLLVRWCLDRIEIWDVSQMPATFLMRTDHSINLEGWIYCTVVGSSVLLVDEMGFIKVFHVDALNSSIELKHNITLEEPRQQDASQRYFDCEYLILVKRNIYVRVNPNKLSMDIIDLECGEKIKTESCPIIDENVKFTIEGIKGSPSDDNVLVLVHLGNRENHCYIYSLKELNFLSVPVIKNDTSSLLFYAIHGDYLAVGDRLALSIYNYKTSERIFFRYFNNRGYPHVLNNRFMFTVEGSEGRLGWFGMYSPSNDMLTILFIHPLIGEGSLHIINDKFVQIRSYSRQIVSVWEVSGESLKRSDIPGFHYSKINRAFTRGVDYFQSNRDSFVYYYL